MEQYAIALTGLAALTITQLKKPHLYKWAPVLGLIGQPFWFHATYKAEQWGIFTLCFAYTLIWMLGFYNHWIKK